MLKMNQLNVFAETNTMSDKNTAALDHMSALTEARVLELFDEEFGLQDLEVADAEIMAFALSIETEVRKQLDGAKIRATEGQAQTSAAIHVLHSPAEPSWNEQREQLQAKVIESALDLAEHTGCMGFSVPISGTTPQISVSLAAQLADSTAPGAPVDPILNFTLDLHAYLSSACPDWVAKEAFTFAPEAVRTALAAFKASPSYLSGCRPEHSEEARRAVTAPTAQQSLTAGGAVPDGWIELNMIFNEDADSAETVAYGPPEMMKRLGKQLDKYYADVIAKRDAAAPLPQVQSEAARDVLAERRRQVEAEGYDHGNDDEYANDEMAAAAAFYVMPPGVRDWPMNGSGYGATMGQAIYPDWMPPKTGTRRRDLVKGAALALAEIERIDRAADQQAVTPSGALADNDGGVAG